MAKNPAEKDKLQQQSEEFREQLQNAFAFVEGQKVTQTFSALTPEECFDRFIERAVGADTQARPNTINRIARVKNEVLSAIEKIKAMPDDAFRAPDPEKDVNTAA